MRSRDVVGGVGSDHVLVIFRAQRAGEMRALGVAPAPPGS